MQVAAGLIQHTVYSALVIMFVLSMPSYAAKPVVLKFCYENKAIPPYFMGAGEVVPKDQPGAIIDILQHLSNTLPVLELRLVRYPWKRCLQSLQSGEVDAVVMSYSDSRAVYAQFPMRGPKPDRKRAISVNDSCLVHQKHLDIRWDGNQLQLPQPVTVAIPAGYKSAKALEDFGLTPFETSSVEVAKQLVSAGRIDSTITDCGDTVAKHLKAHYRADFDARGFCGGE